MIWENSIAWSYIEPVAEDLANKALSHVEIEYITDDEMADYSN
jgi:hypothetical protein